MARSWNRRTRLVLSDPALGRDEVVRYWKKVRYDDLMVEVMFVSDGGFRKVRRDHLRELA